jgi:hypothetical protein
MCIRPESQCVPGRALRCQGAFATAERGYCSVDLGGKPIPCISKAQKLFPVLERFHLLGEGSALVGMSAVL